MKIVVSVGKRPSIREREFGCTKSIDQRSEEVTAEVKLGLTTR